MRNNRFKQIMVGVDGSSASMRATATAYYVADLAGANFQLVHATTDLWVSARRAMAAAASSISSSSGPVFDAALVETAHSNIATELARHLPEGIAAEILVETGRAGPVLDRVAQATGADLVVIGGKHHSALGRWFGGSTAHYLARHAHCPILVVASDTVPISRILVAIDGSDHARAVLTAGERLASTVAGALRVLHAVEPPRVGTLPDDATSRTYVEESRRETEKLVRECAHPGTESTMIDGDAWPAIVGEIKQWDADLLVIGSHGLGFENRQLLGRLSERCLHDLPTSTMVVPLTDVSH